MNYFAFDQQGIDLAQTKPIASKRISWSTNFGKTRPMKNVISTVDDGVPEWSQVEAARGGRSVSRMVGRMLSEAVHPESADALDDLRTSPCDARLAQERSP